MPIGALIPNKLIHLSIKFGNYKLHPTTHHDRVGRGHTSQPPHIQRVVSIQNS